MSFRASTFGLLILLPAAVSAQTPDRAAAEWVLRLGGTVTIEGAARSVRNLVNLPPGEFAISGIDLVGTLADPKDLVKLKGLSHLRELLLPGTMWNPGAGSTLDANDDLASLSHLTSLEKLHVSGHFLSNINIQDKGLAHLAPLTGIKELRLAQTTVKGASLAPFVNLRFLDLSETPFSDPGVESLKGMTSLEKLYLRNTLITDQGLKIMGALKTLTELDLYGVPISDAGLAHLSGLTRLRKLNLLGSNVTDNGVETLTGFTGLEDLNLYRSKITNAGLERLKT